ncbi:MAG TPA: cupin domain-containing protein [Jatrophihabitans sp.]|jgi:mannose-6-phosphate isomerase-like protein (cupin superfamily)
MTEPTRRGRTTPLNLPHAADTLSETWSPRVAGQVNDVLVKVARLEGDFVWHNHPDTDEAFLCLSGQVTIDLRDGDPERERSITLDPGDIYVIPRGVYHCPHSASGAAVALLEAAGVINTGAVDSDLTAPVDRPLDEDPGSARDS